MAQNLSGQNLQGRSFKDLNLTNVDFSNSDLRGANFTRATLIGANFQNSRIGLLYNQKILLIFAFSIFAIISGFCFGFSTYLASLIFNVIKYANSYYEGWVTLIVLLLFFVITLRQGLSAGLSAFAVAVAGIHVVLDSFLVAIFIVLIGSLLGIYAGSIACDFAFKGEGIVSVSILVSMLAFPFGVYLVLQALKGNPRYASIRTFAIAVSSLSGTSFRDANLTDANFCKARVKCADFRNANLTRTNFHQTKNLDTSRVKNTILSDAVVRDLLVTHRGKNRSYAGCNLKGANLEYADLSDADLTAAELENATLVGAWLERSNLTQVQALGTNFSGANLTGACLESWNIDSTTQLEGVVCDYVYLLDRKRERRPSIGEFRSGEFAKLFRVALNTVDLIFRNGLNLQALSASLQKVKRENSNSDLELQSIENQEDGIVVVKVRVSEETDKAQLHANLTQRYNQAVKALEERYRMELQAKNAQIEIYQQQQEDWKELAKLLASRENSESRNSEYGRSPEGKWVILKIGKGSFNQGFPVTLQIGEEGKLPSIECSGELPPAPDIPQSYRQWQSSYRRRADAFFRIEFIDTQVTHFSFQEFIEDCDRTANVLQDRLNGWLNSEAFRSIKERLLETLHPTELIRILLQTSDAELRQLPWYAWDLFERYSKAEIAISTPTYERVNPAIASNNKVKILSILGNSWGIDVTGDRQTLEKLPDAEVTFLVEPNRQELNDRLWEQPWDILFFAGHSASSADGTTGLLEINHRDRLTIPQLKHGLQKAIDRGLKLAIFNSCEGLGLAANLADLQIPQIIVMREPVSDCVAQAFLKHFLSAFASGTSLYLSLREAREKLQGLEDEFPGATWLPILCQNPAVSPGTWEDFYKQ